MASRPALFTGASVASRAFEAIVAAAAIMLSDYFAVHLPAPATPLGAWPVIMATAAIGVAAIAPGGIFTIPTGQKAFRNPGSGAVFAILLALPLRQALPIASCGMLAAQLLRRYYRRERLTWQTIAFNLAQYVVTWTVVSAMFTRVQLDAATWPEAVRWPAAAVAAGAVYIAVNTWLVSVWNALRRRAVAWNLWVHIVNHLTSTQWVVLGIGAIAARLAERHPLLALDVIVASWVAYWAGSRLSDARFRELASSFGAIVEAAERCRPGFDEHSERVSWWVENVARRLGMSEDDAIATSAAAKLHDLGKIAMGIPIDEDAARTDSGAAVRFHPVVAGDTLMRCRGLERIAWCIRFQGEWYDGSGYPNGLADSGIPLASRIIAVADAYDMALCRGGSARDGCVEQALAQINRGAGTRFDPVVVGALEAIVGEKITACAYADAFAAPGPVMAFAGGPTGMAVRDAVSASDDISALPQHAAADARHLPWDPLTPRERGRTGSLLDRLEADRRYLARELHDEIGGTLTALSQMLKAVPGCAAVRDAQAVVQTLMELVRNLSLDLRPAILDDLGLAPALRWYADRHGARTGTHVSFTHTGIDRRFDPTIETAAYRIVQEALTNAAKHAQAGKVTIVAEERYGLLTITVCDDGTGFNPEATRRSGRASGLVGMRERTISVGGSLRLTSQPGRGTRVEAFLPITPTGQWKRAR